MRWFLQVVAFAGAAAAAAGPAGAHDWCRGLVLPKRVYSFL
jgi:hypothetical protein